eukprot:310887_1
MMLNTQQQLEEEKEFNLSFKQYENKNRSYSNQIEFVEPLVSDYQCCKDGDHEAQNCNVLRRILHLLTFCQQHQMDKRTHTQIYEYISSLKNYDVPTFMEDWYQIKNNHLRGKNGVNWLHWIRNSQDNECDIECQYLRRHHRQRGNEVYFNKETNPDYKNIILMDQLDSIHVFIWHSITFPRNSEKTFNNVSTEFCNNQSEQTEEKIEESIWNNKPDAISECNTQQILWILNNDVFEKLKPKIKDILIMHRSNITKYVKENECNGSKLTEMKRKKFMINVAAYLNDNKLKAPLGQLYTAIMKYDEMKMVNIWSNNPSSIDECNMDQIVCIVEDYLTKNNVDELVEHKNNIINYIKQNKIDGAKLKQMKRKDFMTATASYLHNNKLKIKLGMLRKNIIECDLSQFTGIGSKRIPVMDDNDQQTNNKFATEVNLDTVNESYYSFGQQYRYTYNLKQHPFYVKSKYNSLKQELEAYFVDMYNQTDAEILIQSQLKMIQEMDTDHDLQSMLTTIIKLPLLSDMVWQYIKTEHKHNYLIVESIKTEDETFRNTIREIIQLLPYLKENDDVSQRAYDVLTQSLQKRFVVSQKKYKQCLENYFRKLQTSDIDRYYSNIRKYINPELDTESNYLRNVENDVLFVYKNVFKKQTDLTTYVISDLIKKNVKEKKLWINEYFVKHSDELNEIKFVTDMFYEIIKIPKHIFFREYVQNQMSNHDNLDMKEIESDYDGFDWIFERIFNIKYVESRNVINDFVIQNISQDQADARKALNSLIDANIVEYEIDSLTALTKLDRKCTDLIDMLSSDSKTNNNEKHLISVLINILRIKVAKINQLNRIYAKKMSKIEGKIRSIAAEMDVTQHTKAPFVFPYFFEFLTKAEIHDISMESSYLTGNKQDIKIGKEHLNDILLEICNVHSLKNQVISVENQYSQFVTEMIDNVALSKPRSYIDNLCAFDNITFNDIEVSRLLKLQQERFIKLTLDVNKLCNIYADQYDGESEKFAFIILLSSILNTRKESQELIEKMSYQFPGLEQIWKDTDEWLENSSVPQLNPTGSIKLHEIINKVLEMSDIDSYEKLMSEMNTQFREMLLQILKKKCYAKKTSYVESWARERSKPYIEKAQTKIQTQSIKQMKASWYRGINEHHQIKSSQPIRLDHVLALISYTDYTELCTAFRATYRKISNNESVKDQIARHAEFANFGRLLYESFV